MLTVNIRKELVSSARSGLWGGAEKIESYCISDNRSKQKVEQDRLIGNIAELITYEVFKERGFDCAQPSQLTPGLIGRWEDDLRFFQTLYITRNNKKIDVGQHITIKSQTKSIADRFGESYMFQLFDAGPPRRSADPMTCEPKPSLLVCVLVLPPEVILSNEGWEAEIKLFFWPDIFTKLADPKKIGLRGKKKVIYIDQVRKYEVNMSEVFC